MGKESNIEWCDASWNPWHGCTKVSSGCQNCYMFRDKERWKQDGSIIKRSSKSVFNMPLKLKGSKKIFLNSWSDFWIPEADGWRDKAYEIIKNSPHTYLILTKRPERILDHLPKDWGKGYPNVWLGISVEDQKNYDERAFIFGQVPAKIKFFSAEPLLGPITKIHQYFDWGIIGGESGRLNGDKYIAREMKIKWVEHLLEQMGYFDIKAFVKQVGSVTAKEMGMKDQHGRLIEEFPRSIRVREFPSYNIPQETK